eukprot:6417987-Alexandrium_andersonii.AAC.1
MVQDFAGCGLEDCGLELSTSHIRDFVFPRSLHVVGGFGIYARRGAERPLSGTSGTRFEAVLGPA